MVKVSKSVLTSITVLLSLSIPATVAQQASPRPGTIPPRPSSFPISRISPLPGSRTGPQSAATAPIPLCAPAKTWPVKPSPSSRMARPLPNPRKSRSKPKASCAPRWQPLPGVLPRTINWVRSTCRPADIENRFHSCKRPISSIPQIVATNTTWPLRPGKRRSFAGAPACTEIASAGRQCRPPSHAGGS